MIYTSGTTGKPKGAYRNATDPATAMALIGFIGYTPDDVYLTSGPLYHSGPSAFMGAGLALGQTDRRAAQVRSARTGCGWSTRTRSARRSRRRR